MIGLDEVNLTVELFSLKIENSIINMKNILALADGSSEGAPSRIMS